MQALLRTSDKLEQTKRTMHESEETARNVLIDLELQRSQLQDVKGMVRETSSITGEVRSLLQKIADRAYRRKVRLSFIHTCARSHVLGLGLTAIALSRRSCSGSSSSHSQ